MPKHLYRCSTCAYAVVETRKQESKDRAKLCPNCQHGDLIRRFVVSSRDKFPSRPSPHRKPFVENVRIVNFKDGTGIVVDGPIVVDIENIEIGNTATAIELRNGARVDVKSFRHFSDEAEKTESGRNKRRRKGRRK
jgi:DNA-directed RNA polymerase subunit RPC12/RpoP